MYHSDKEGRERYEKRLEEISQKYHGLEVRYMAVTREEKDMIVKAMELAQGHWYKCPNGRYLANMTTSQRSKGSTVG